VVPEAGLPKASFPKAMQVVEGAALVPAEVV
jgi:hypothetical protein